MSKAAKAASGLPSSASSAFRLVYQETSGFSRIRTNNRTDQRPKVFRQTAKSTEGRQYVWYPAKSPRFRAMAEDKTRQERDIDWFLCLRDIPAVREWVAERRKVQKIIGFVPTMGALHKGHLELARKAAEECDEVIVSIYVNPSQFGANEDLSSYPRPFRDDLRLLGSLNASLESARVTKYRGRVSAIFNPTDQVMYPFGFKSESKMTIDSRLTQTLEGKSRPTFFQGVTTIVLKLLNIVQPDYVYFGQKDIQQTVVIRRMIDEFHLPVTLRTVPTIREEDGLAFSSRNLYLGYRRRQQATVLYKSLSAGSDVANSYGFNADVPRKDVLDAVLAKATELQGMQRELPPSERVRFELDYISIADPFRLEEVESIRKDTGAILSGAMVMLPLEEPQPGEILGIGMDEKKVRLIDNVLLGGAGMPLGVRTNFFRKIGNPVPSDSKADDINFPSSVA